MLLICTFNPLPLTGFIAYSSSDLFVRSFTVLSRLPSWLQQLHYDTDAIQQAAYATGSLKNIQSRVRSYLLFVLLLVTIINTCLYPIFVITWFFHRLWLMDPSKITFLCYIASLNYYISMLISLIISSYTLLSECTA